MAEPVTGPETGGRSLADILREAGIENPSRSGRRRRWDDVDDAGIRQRRPDSGAEAPAARGDYGRRAGDLPLDRTPEPADRRGRDRRRGVPLPDRRGDDRRDPGPPLDGREGRGTGRGRESTGTVSSGGPSTAAIPGLRPSRTPAVPAPASEPAGRDVRGTEGRRREEVPQRGRRRDAAAGPRPDSGERGPATGPIPTIGPDGAIVAPADLGGPKEGALAWVRFVGELIVAAAVGVGVYFAFTVLWELLPYVAALASPVVVTALVWGVSAYRQRHGREPVRPRLLALLVFAGTVLSILPAAGLLTGA